MSDSKLNEGKGQSGIEVITTYGWVVLVAVGGILLLSQVGVFRPSHCDKSRIAFSQVVPTDWAAYANTNTFVLEAENWAGHDIQITGVSVALERATCSAVSDAQLGPGNRTLLVLTCPDDFSGKYLVGDCYTADVDFTYINQASGNSATSKGKIRGSIEIGSVATSITTTSTSTTTTSTTSTSTTTTSTTSTSTTTTSTTTTTTPPELELLSPTGTLVL